MSAQLGNPWAGKYNVETRWGGERGTFEPIGMIVVSPSGAISLKDRPVTKLKIDGETFSWELSDQNTSAASFTFSNWSINKYFWPSGITQYCFTGWLLWSGEGRLDCRGSWALSNWDGNYSTQIRWGGVQGTWHSGSDLYVSPTGEVRYGQTVIRDVSLTTEKKLEWKVGGGNPQSASITFSFGCSDRFYFNKPQPSSVGCFVGTLQNPGEGPIDFRGSASTLDN